MSQLLPSKEKLGCDKIFFVWKGKFWCSCQLGTWLSVLSSEFLCAELLKVLYRPHLYWSQIILIANHLSELMSS